MTFRVRMLLAVALALASAGCGKTSGPQNQTGMDGDSSATGADSPTAPDPMPAPPDAEPESWSIVVLPDTQGYTHNHPEIFRAQGRWIAANKEVENIKFVVHVGDIVDFNTDDEWQVARQSLAPLSDAGLPFALAVGNHDYDTDDERQSRLAEHFPKDVFASLDGAYDASLDSTFHTFDVGDESWLVLVLEWGPRDAVLDWADEVLSEHPDHQALVVTHGYLYLDGSRYDWATKGESQDWNPHRYGPPRWPEVNDGEEIWTKLLRKHDNVRLVVCGHAAREGVARLTSERPDAPPVHQLLANFQDAPKGGAGYLRILRFSEDSIDVETYSPYLDHSYKGPEHKFTLER